MLYSLLNDSKLLRSQNNDSHEPRGPVNPSSFSARVIKFVSKIWKYWTNSNCSKKKSSAQHDAYEGGFA